MSQEPSKYYIGQTDNIVDAFAKRNAKEHCAYLLPHLSPDMSILDVGCGPGSITIDLARHVPRGRVVGVDIEAASATLQKARTQAEIGGVTNVEFQTGDAHTLPFPDNTFDITHSHQVIHSSDDPVRFMLETHRVTKPGGFVACRVWDSASWILHPYNEGIASFWAMWWRIDTERGLAPHTGRNLHVWARQAGFDPGRVKISTSTLAFRTPAERAWCGGIFKAMCKESEFATVALKKGYYTAEDLERMADGWRKWIEDADGFGAMIDVELLYQK